MVSEKLAEFVKKELEQGVSKENLRQALMIKGWKKEDIDEVLHDSAEQKLPEPSKTEPALPTQDAEQSMPSQPDNTPAKEFNKIDTPKKERKPWLMALLTLITGGLFGIYWLVVTARDLPGGPNPKLLWLILIPAVNVIILIIFHLKLSRAINERTGFSYVVSFLMLFFLFPIGVYVIQDQINKH